MADAMKLYGYFRSSTSYRVRILVGLKSLNVQHVEVDLIKNGGQHKHANFLAMNPQGLLPVLELPNGQILTQSPAIMEYLDEAYPNKKMLPEAAIDRAKVRAMMSLVACEIHPLNNLRVLNYLKGELHHSQDETDIWYRHWVKNGFHALEQMVGDGGYCYGSTLSMADIYLIPQLYNARRFNLDMAPYPKLVKIGDKCKKIPAFIAAHPKMVKDNN